MINIIIFGYRGGCGWCCYCCCWLACGGSGAARKVQEFQWLLTRVLRGNQRISYAVLMEELDIPTVRQLEDFLINDCIYTGLVKGRLNQKEKLLRVEECSPRDVRRPDLPLVLAGAKEWCARPASQRKGR